MYGRITAALCAVAVMVAGVGCGSSDDTATTGGANTAGATARRTATKKIGFFGPSSPYGEAQREAAREWAAANGAEVKVYDSGIDPQQQYSQIQSAIVQHQVDGMVIFALNGPSIAPLVKQAKDAGIAAVAVGGPLGTDFTTTDPMVPGLDGLVWTPSAQQGEWLAKQVVDACQGIDPCQAVYIPILGRLPQEVALYRAFEQTIKRSPNVTLVPEPAGAEGRPDAAVGITQDLLQAHPDLDVIAAVDTMALNAEVGLKKSGRKWGNSEGEVRLIGISGTQQGVQRVRDGAWSSTQVSLPNEEIVAAMTLAKDAIDGELAQPKGVDPVASSKYPPVMTREAIDQSGFTGEYAA